MKCIAVVLVFCTMSLAQTAIGADRLRNIFDDDWTPPKIAEKPRPPATVIPPPSTPTDPPAKNSTPKPPSPKPTPANPVAPQPPARLPVPAKPAQAAVRQVMKEVFAEQLADRSIPARRKLAAALLAQADKSSQVPADQFVLLAAAIDASVDAINLPAALEAADRMADAFDVDGLGVKADAALRLGPKSSLPDAAAENIDAVLELSRDLARADDYATAARVCAALQPAAATTPVLRAQLQQRQRELVLARDAADRFARDLAKLKDSPDDPAANLAVGRYTCLIKGEWEMGLPTLAKGSDLALKSLAARELTHATTPDEIAGVADAWWDAAAKQPDAASRVAVTAHAAALYERSVNGIAGLRKVQIEKRIAEAAKLASSVPMKVASGSKRVVNLLKLIDPKRDGVNGIWEVNGSSLTCGKERDSKLGVPYDPPDEYDYHIVFTRNEYKETVQAMFSGNGHSAWLVLWGDNKINFGVQKVDDKERWANVTTGKLDTSFKNNQRYDCLIQVRKDSVTALLDGKQLFNLKTDFSNLEPGGHWKVRDAKLGVGANENSVTFNVIEIIEVSGSGKLTVSPAR